MPGILDWLFGAGPLKQASATGDSAQAANPPAVNQPPVIDMAAEAAKMVPKATPPPAPLAVSPALKPKRKAIVQQSQPAQPTTAQRIGSQMQQD